MKRLATKDGNFIEMVKVNCQEDIENLVSEGYLYFSDFHESPYEFEERLNIIAQFPLNPKNCYGRNLKMDEEVKDKDFHVREVIAEQGYGLDKLINDEDYEIRMVVARQGYGLDKLINDEAFYVKMCAVKWLDKNSMSLKEWKERYPDKCVL